jgi:hypothetical protein
MNKLLIFVLSVIVVALVVTVVGSSSVEAVNWNSAAPHYLAVNWNS